MRGHRQSGVDRRLGEGDRIAGDQRPGDAVRRAVPADRGAGARQAHPVRCCSRATPRVVVGRRTIRGQPTLERSAVARRDAHERMLGARRQPIPQHHACLRPSVSVALGSHLGRNTTVPRQGEIGIPIKLGIRSLRVF